MPTSKISFSTDSISKLTCPAGKQRLIVYDKKHPKLACVVSKTGIKTFALHAYDRVNKKPLQHTLGRYPDISINHARDIAGKLLAQMAEGVDIKAAIRAIREEPTVDDIFHAWLKRAQKDTRTWKEAERAYYRHIQPTFGTKRISSVSQQQVRQWHVKLTETPRIRKKNNAITNISQTTANRHLASLKAIFNQEASHLPNPCSKVKAYREESRDRFLKPDELRLFFQALDDIDTPEYLRDLIYLALYTGARRSNLFSMSWGEIDFTSKTWTIPAHKSKSGKTMEIPLVEEAILIIRKRRTGTRSIFVFPGNGRKGHLVEPKRAWTNLVARSGLSNLRLHDLRRTCGSYQAATGANQAVISKSLGHQNIATTAVYTRINIDPVRESLAKAAEAMQSTRLVDSKIHRIGEE